MKVLSKSALAAMAAAATVAMATSAKADTYVLDAVDWVAPEFFSFGAPTGNSIQQIDLGVGSVVTGVDLDITVTASDGAWLSDFGLAFFPLEVVPDGGPGLILTPGVADGFGGTATYVASWDLNDNIGDPNAPQPFALASGMLWVEAMDWEGIGTLHDINGTVTIHYTAVPAPGALALLGLAGVVGARRRRRN